MMGFINQFYYYCKFIYEITSNLDSSKYIVKHNRKIYIKTDR